MKIRNLLVMAAFLMLFSCAEKRANPLIQNLDKSWIVTTDTLNIKMEVDVPSVIQADMYENGLIPHPYKSNIESPLFQKRKNLGDAYLLQSGSDIYNFIVGSGCSQINDCFIDIKNHKLHVQYLPFM